MKQLGGVWYRLRDISLWELRPGERVTGLALLHATLRGPLEEL